MDKTTLGDRMKMYEGEHRFMPLLPIIVRVDGRAFHSYTRGLKRPYDNEFIECMVETTKDLVKETNALVGYTQSDEISLLLHSSSYDSQVYFDGKIFKIVSMTAAVASHRFMYYAKTFLDKTNVAMFDSRAFQVPNETEAANYFLWRERDATRNSILSAGYSEYSPSQMHKKNTSEIQEMLHDRGINWNDYPNKFKRGTFVRRVTVKRAFTPDLDYDLPEKHHARTNPDLVIERTDIRVVEAMPCFGRVSNKSEFLFAGAEPLVREGEPDNSHPAMEAGDS
jgi:tRNA(His) guanylyltransferase